MFLRKSLKLFFAKFNCRNEGRVSVSEIVLDGHKLASSSQIHFDEQNFFQLTIPSIISTKYNEVLKQLLQS